MLPFVCTWACVHAGLSMRLSVSASVSLFLNQTREPEAEFVEAVLYGETPSHPVALSKDLFWVYFFIHLFLDVSPHLYN